MKMTEAHHQFSTAFLQHVFDDKMTVKFNQKFMTITLKIGGINVVCRYKRSKVVEQNFIIYVPTFCHVLTAMEAMRKIRQSDEQHASYRKFVIKSLHATKAQNVVFTYNNPEKSNA